MAAYHFVLACFFVFVWLVLSNASLYTCLLVSGFCLCHDLNT